MTIQFTPLASTTAIKGTPKTVQVGQFASPGAPETDFDSVVLVSSTIPNVTISHKKNYNDQQEYVSHSAYAAFTAATAGTGSIRYRLIKNSPSETREETCTITIFASQADIYRVQYQLVSPIPKVIQNVAFSWSIGRITYPTNTQAHFETTPGALPSGLSLTTAGILSGSLATVGTYAIPFIAFGSNDPNDSCEPAHGSFNLQCVAAPPQVIDVELRPLEGIINTEYAWTAGVALHPLEGVTWLLWDRGTLPTNATLSQSGVLEVEFATAGTYTFQLKASASGFQSVVQKHHATISDKPQIIVNLNALPNATLNTPYSQSLGTVTRPASGAVWALLDRGTFPVGTAVSSAGLLTTTITAYGTYTGQATITATGFTTKTISFTAKAISAPPSVIDVTMQAATLEIETAYTLTVGVVHHPSSGSSWTLSDRGNLPLAANLSSGGVLTVTFTTAGTYTFSVQISADGYTTITRTHSYVVYDKHTILVTLASLPNTNPSTAYSQSLGTVTRPASGAVWALSDIGDFPPGTEVSSGGILSTNLPAVGHYEGEATITATGYNTKTIGFKVSAYANSANPGQITVAWNTLPNGKINTAYSQSLGTVTLPNSGATWRRSAITGTLPVGFVVGSSGILSGTPTTAGSFNFFVEIFANGYAKLLKELRLVVTSADVPPDPSRPPPPPPDYPVEPETPTTWTAHRTLTDSNGQLLPTQNDAGRVDYQTGQLYFPPELTQKYRQWSNSRNHGSGEWLNITEQDAFTNASTVTVSYAKDITVPAAVTESLPTSTLAIRLAPYTTDSIVPGSVSFRIGDITYTDIDGIIYHTPDENGYGTRAGTIDYSRGLVLLDEWVSGASTFTLLSLATQRGQFTETAFQFRTALAPLRPTGFQFAVTAVDGELLTGSSDVNGDITGNAMLGEVEAEFGVVDIRFGEYVLDSSLTPEEKAEEWYDAGDVLPNGTIWYPRKIIPSTARYNAVAYSSLPLSAELLGLDPVRLPSDGRVPSIIKGDMVVISHQTTHSVQSPVAGGTVDTELTAVARARVYDADGDAVPPSRYSLAQDTGILTWATPLDLSGYTAPYSVEATIEDAALVTDADISGRLVLNRALTHDYPIGARVSTAYVFGDLFAQATNPFSQQAWTSVWQSERVGLPILAQYNNLSYPILLNNASSWRERWLLLFTSQTSFRVIGETLGDITDALGGAGYHDIDHDLAPINPLTNTPYFTLSASGWSTGWVAGNCLRFDMIPPANFPVWIAMTVHPSAPTTGQDRFRLLLRGGIDA